MASRDKTGFDSQLFRGPILGVLVEVAGVGAQGSERSCMTCAQFNASYSICDLKGHVGRPTYPQVSEWIPSEKDAQKLYERILRMLKIPSGGQTA